MLTLIRSTKYSQPPLMMGRGKSLLSPTSTSTILRQILALPLCQTWAPLSCRTVVPVAAYSARNDTAGGSVIAGKGTNENPIKDNGPNDEYLKWAGLQAEQMPKHVMVVLDGNRRWCEKNGWELTYQPFYRRYIMLAELCIKLGIPTASWSVFATCTWKRSLEAKDLIFRQFQESLEDNWENFIRQGIKVSVIGEKRRLPESLQDVIKGVEEGTKSGKTLHMIYHMIYGGRWDIVEAAQSIGRKAMAGEIEAEDVDEALVQQQLSTSSLMADIPDPDLMVRCGGKRRFSNFYLWQLAHTELYFSDLLYFEFGEAEFLDALRWFQQCGRRFGK